MQTKVNINLAVGVPGAYASVNPIISTPLGRKAAVDVPFGGFCWDDPEKTGLVRPGGSGRPLGFVVREITYPVTNVNAEAQETVPAGCNVSVEVRGDFYVKVENGCTKGQKVFANLEDGSVAAGDEGGEVEGCVETDFVFASSVDAGGIAVISSY